MKMNKIIPLILVVAVVVISGCTGLTGLTGGGSGGAITIRSFTISDTNVEPRSTSYLELTLENTGGQTARGVNINLMGLTDEWGIYPSRSISVGDMAPKIRDQAGQKEVITWTLTAPEKDVQQSYPITAAVSYNFDSKYNANFKVVSYDWYRLKNDKGGISSEGYTDGPITIRVTTQSSYISGGRYPVIINIQNTGSGRVYMGSISNQQDLDRMAVTVSGAACRNTEVRLADGKSASLYCYIEAPITSGYKIYPVEVSATYSYFVDSTTSVTLMPAIPY
jgi:hypothetical protein